MNRLGSMRQIKITLFAVLFIILNQPLAGQETAIYRNELLKFYEAKENFERKNYALAADQFREYLATVHEKDDEIQTYKVEAAYKAAISAKHLKRATAKKELTAFIAEYGYHRKYNSLANFHLADMYFAQREYRAAISCYEQVFIKDLFKEEKERLLFNLGYAHFNLKEFEPAKQYFKQAIQKKGPNYYHTNYYLGYMAYENGNYDEALQYFKVTEKDKRYGLMVPYYVSQILFQQGKNDELLSYLEPRFKQRNLKYKEELSKLLGLVYYQRKQFNKALPYLETYVVKTPKVEKEDLYMLAYTQYQFGDYEKATTNFSELTTLETDLGQNALYHLADCYLKTNQKELAKTAFDGASRLDFDNNIVETSLFNSAKISYELSDFNTAVAGIKSFIQKYPNSRRNLEAKTMLGRAFEQTNNYKDAIETIESLPNPNTELKNVYQKMTYSRALELYIDGKKDQALRMFQKSFKYPQSNRLNALSRFWMGNIYYEQNNVEAAEQYLQEYINMAGNTVEGKVSPASANYTIGYIYFDDKDYKKAQPYFDKASKGISASDRKNNEVLSKIYPDAILRSADCNFKERKYKEAGKQYQRIIEMNAYGADYATFQQGMIAGLESNFNKKISILKKVNQYKDSYYGDDALYQLGSTQTFVEDFDGAISSFNQLIKKYPKSKFARKSQLEIGLANYRLGNGQKAITAFEKVIKKAPKSQEAQLALANIQNIYIERGDSDGYFSYIKKFPNIELSTSGQDTLSYQFAETLFESGDCTGAIKEFDKYLIRHPQGAFTDYAHYYRGDCLFGQKNYPKALSDLAIIADQPDNPFFEDALSKAAYISTSINKDAESGYNYYQKLYGIASNPKSAERSLFELTFLSYELGRYNEFKSYANDFLQSANYSNEDKLLVDFYKAKVAYAGKNFKLAKERFDYVARFNRGEIGAEARYQVAKILYDQGAYDAARRSCYRVDDETPSQEYWRVKAFIMIADIYAKQDNLFQANSTLQSIVDNYSSDMELLNEAREKLALYKARAVNDSKLKVESETDTMQLDERF